MLDKDYKQEGFWSGYGKENDKFITPRASANEGWVFEKRLFLLHLEKVEEKASTRRFKGSSTCRICGERNGSATFYYKGWCWPSGFSHYIKRHDIKPTAGFMSFIAMNR